MRVLAFVAACVASTDALGAGSAGGLDWRYFAAGGVSAAVSHGYTTPLDVIKTRLQSGHVGSKSGFAVIGDLVKEEGFSAFFKGLTPKILVVGPKLIFSFTIAQQLMQYFEKVL